MIECDHLPAGRKRVCNGSSGLPLEKVNEYREKWGIEPLGELPETSFTYMNMVDHNFSQYKCDQCGDKTTSIGVPKKCIACGVEPKEIKSLIDNLDVYKEEKDRLKIIFSDLLDDIFSSKARLESEKLAQSPKSNTPFYKNKIITIDKAYCLHHPIKRPNIKEGMVNDAITNVGKNAVIDFFEVGIHYIDDIRKDATKNAIQCHRKMIQNCIDAGHENVLFLEDDIAFTKDFIQILDSVKIPKDYDALYLGGYSRGECNTCCTDMEQTQYYDPENVKNPRFIYSTRLWGLYGVIINKKSLIDMLSAPKHIVMDTSLISTNPNARVYILNAPIILEKDVRTAIGDDIQPREMYSQAIREGRIDE